MKSSKTMKIEKQQQIFEDKVKVLRKQLVDVSDEDLMLFSDWLDNNELCTITRFIESKAYDQSCEPETF
jgi:hypothetical protein